MTNEPDIPLPDTRSLPIYTKGNDLLEPGCDYMTYGISISNWGNKIEVYGDAELRDHILKLLNRAT